MFRLTHLGNADHLPAINFEISLRYMGDKGEREEMRPASLCLSPACWQAGLISGFCVNVRIKHKFYFDKENFSLILGFKE